MATQMTFHFRLNNMIFASRTFSKIVYFPQTGVLFLP